MTLIYGGWIVRARKRAANGELVTVPAAGPFEDAVRAMAEAAVIEAEHRAGFGPWQPPFAVDYVPA